MADLPQSTPSVAQPTDYSHFVLQAVKTGSKEGGLDQAVVRTALSLCASFLITDTSTNEMTRGSQTWFTGLNQLVDLLVALHARDELEVDTFNAASKACSECWSVIGTWRGLEECREGIRKVGAKLRRLLDEEGFTYRGEAIYSPLAPVRAPPRVSTTDTSDAMRRT